ncbi:MAG: hypothetical protein CL547_11700 [Alcanivorax sp.]|nr:hypothetical protein [Alcanivorax sp.]|tara:strand:+ start:2439 stop:2963 length:525 start_codon:yes stop_codon:yes gene_type:complete
MTNGVKEAMRRFYSERAPKMDMPKLKKKRRKGDPISEEMIQNRVVSALRKIRINGLPVFVFHIPMGGKRDAIAASRLKRSGAISGTPDLLILNPPCAGVKGVFWELKKTPAGRVSENQAQFMSRASDLGFLCVVAKGLDANMKLVEILYEGKETKTRERIANEIDSTDGISLVT